MCIPMLKAFACCAACGETQANTLRQARRCYHFRFAYISLQVWCLRLVGIPAYLPSILHATANDLWMKSRFYNGDLQAPPLTSCLILGGIRLWSTASYFKRGVSVLIKYDLFLHSGTVDDLFKLLVLLYILRSYYLLFSCPVLPILLDPFHSLALWCLLIHFKWFLPFVPSNEISVAIKMGSESPLLHTTPVVYWDSCATVQE